MKVLVATAIYPTPERPAFGSFVRTQVESLRRIGVDAEPFVLVGRNRKLMYPRGTVQLRRRMRRGDVDVVHAHYSFVGAVACCQRAAPVVLTFHGDDLLGTIGADGRQTTGSHAIVVAGKAVARLVDTVIVQNSIMAARLSWHPRVHVLPHEVDLDVFRPAPRDEARRLLGLDCSRRYVLFASPPDIPVKRFPLAQAAVEGLRKSDASVELVTVFNEAQDRLALYMSACDALVFPSYQEGSPNIVKQAMACNLPIVATDVGDVARVTAGTAGCFVVEPDAGLFADRLRRIFEAGARTDGRKRVYHLESSLVAGRLREVYADVAARSTELRRRSSSFGDQ